MEKYDLLNQIGDGTFGSVAKAVSKKTGQLVAIKKMKQKFYTWEECVKLPEVDVVRRIHRHPNVVKLSEVIRENNELYFVFEFMDGDLLSVIKKAKAAQRPEDAATSPAIPYPKVKSYMRQLLQALAYVHKRGYFHRDLKPENLLIRQDGQGEEVVKLADFGLVKEIRARPPFTDYVSTRWYRAPELLLQDRAYNAPVDIFAAGCIMCELITTRPLFPGSNEVDQLFKIMTILGSPTEKTWAAGFALARKIRYTFPSIHGSGLAKVLPPHIPFQALDLITQMLLYDPRQRPTAEQCLHHPYFSVGIDENNAATQEQRTNATHAYHESPQSAPTGGPPAEVSANASTAAAGGESDPKRFLTAQAPPPLTNLALSSGAAAQAPNASPQKFYMVGVPKATQDAKANYVGYGGANMQLSPSKGKNLISPYKTKGIKDESGRSKGSSPPACKASGDGSAEAGLNLDELLSEFTTELNMHGITAQKQGGGASPRAQKQEPVITIPSKDEGKTSIPQVGNSGRTKAQAPPSISLGGETGANPDPVAALLNGSRYKKSSFSVSPANTNLHNQPDDGFENNSALAQLKAFGTSSVNNNKYGGKMAKNEASGGNNSGVSPSILALLARQREGGGDGFGFS